MLELAMSLIIAAGHALWDAFYGLLMPAIAFVALAGLVKGRRVFAEARKALPQTRVTLLMMCFNVVVVGPVLALLLTVMNEGFRGSALHLTSQSVWARVPVPAVIFAAIFAGDFVGYWRHRIEHSHLLWPSHAVHHSDTEMTWLALERFHPINRLTTFVIDNGFLLLLGFPTYALVANNFVRHYYGYLIHADVPWTYGTLGGVFVSPAMHRWHHAADKAAFDTNYATVFSLFDRWFGTLRVPGPCTATLGVTESMGSGVVGQLFHPFRPSSYKPLTLSILNRIRRSATPLS